MSAPVLVVDERQVPAPRYPVQSANVLTHVHENLPAEHAAVRAKEAELCGDLEELRRYRVTLEAVASAAGIALP